MTICVGMSSPSKSIHMKQSFVYFIYSLTASAVITTTSCTKSFLDNEAKLPEDIELPEEPKLVTHNPNLVGSTIRYKISGDITGKINFYFAQSDGSNVPYGNLNGTELPWDFSYEEVEDSYAVGGYAIGDIKPYNGYYYGPLTSFDIGKSINFEFFVDGKLIETAERIINDNGFILIGAESPHSLPIYYLDKQTSNKYLNKEIKYEITGDFGGKGLQILYMDENSVIHTDIIENLPWSYSFTAGNESKIARVYFLGTTDQVTSAKKGETATINIFVDDTLVRTGTEIYDETPSFGFIVEEYPLYDY